MWHIIENRSKKGIREIFKGNRRVCETKLKTLRSSAKRGKHCGIKGIEKVEYKLEETPK